MKRFFVFSIILMFAAVSCSKWDTAELYEQEELNLESYFANKKITAQKIATGLYYVGDTIAVKRPKERDTVTITYKAYILEGKSPSYQLNDLVLNDGGNKSEDSLKFVIGNGSVIPGLEKGVLQINQNDTATLYICSRNAYGNKKHGPIPAFSTMRFDVYLKSVK